MNQPNNCIWKWDGKTEWECRNCNKATHESPHMGAMTSMALDEYLEAKYQYRLSPIPENFHKLKHAFHVFYHVRGLTVSTPERIQMGFGLGSLYMGENTFL